MIRDLSLTRLATRLALLAVLAAPAAAQQLAPEERARIDSAAVAVLAGTGAPSASVAIVRGGEIVYEQAYGEGRIGTPAESAMRYAIGSVSKQFTATAILLLAEEGKLSLDDKVARWFPKLTRANEVTIRQLLSMTSGYQDFWPQDYVFTAMQGRRRRTPSCSAGPVRPSTSILVPPGSTATPTTPSRAPSWSGSQECRSWSS